MVRLVSGLTLALVSFACIFAGPGLVAAEILLLSLIALREFYNLARRKQLIPSEATGMAAGVGLVLLVASGHAGWMPHYLSGMVVVILVVFLFRKEYHVSPLLDAGLTLLGVLYIPWLFSYAILIRMLPGGEWWLTVVVVGTAMYDTAAYYVGRRLGRRPLVPQISPGKTVEGTVGGGIVSVAVVVGFGLVRGWPLGPVMGLAILLAVAAQFGDLCESLLKRDVGVKDAGNILAGHGGILDRCDSLFFSCPAAYLYLRLILGLY